MIDKDEIVRTVQPEDNIVCKTCRFKLQPVEVNGRKVERYKYGNCSIFENKPMGVLLRGEKCDFYRPE